jgi:hypothetical protein
MTCQFNFLDRKGGCSFINQSDLEGKGCMKIEAWHVTKREVLETVVLCAPHVPPMQSATKPLSFRKSTLDACEPEMVGQGKGRERIERCELKLSVVKR